MEMWYSVSIIKIKTFFSAGFFRNIEGVHDGKGVNEVVKTAKPLAIWKWIFFRWVKFAHFGKVD